MFNLWRELAPNLGRGIIGDQFVLSPADTETILPNMLTALSTERMI